jgi:hypothetical protein
MFEVIKPANLDIKDTACLHVVHFLEHPTSCPKTRSAQDKMVNAPKKNLSPVPAGKYFEAIGDSLSDPACSEDEEDGTDEDDDEDDIGHCKLREDDKPGWVMGTISKTVHHRMESIRQKQMRLDELMQPGWGDASDYFRESDMKSRTPELKVLAVGKPQTDSTAATPSPTTFGELMQALDMVRRQSQMPLVTS